MAICHASEHSTVRYILFPSFGLKSRVPCPGMQTDASFACPERGGGTRPGAPTPALLPLVFAIPTRDSRHTHAGVSMAPGIQMAGTAPPSSRRSRTAARRPRRFVHEKIPVAGFLPCQRGMDKTGQSNVIPVVAGRKDAGVHGT